MKRLVGMALTTIFWTIPSASVCPAYHHGNLRYNVYSSSAGTRAEAAVTVYAGSPSQCVVMDEPPVGSVVDWEWPVAVDVAGNVLTAPECQPVPHDVDGVAWSGM